MSLQPVRGTHDLLPEAAEKFQKIIELSKEMARRHGFREIATPIFEFTQVFNRTLGESSDIVSKEMYSFPDRGGDSITLRPEGTAGIARAFISEGLAQHSPLKLFYAGPMFRYERPQKGRQRQFHQIGVELIGVPSVQADVECIALADLTLKALGLNTPPTLHLNSIGDLESRKNYREQFVQYLKKYEKDLSEDSQRRLQENPLRIWDSKSPGDQKILEEAPLLNQSLNADSKKFFDELQELLSLLKIPFQLDPKLVRGLDYYCHTVFEFKSSDLGAQDTVLAGGRYDGLISQMGGPHTPGVGWAAGLERLMLMSKLEVTQPFTVAVIPLGEDAEKEALLLCHRLRESGFVAEMSYSGNLSKRMKKAASLNAKAAVILGSEELKKGTAMLKDLTTGVQLEVKSADLESLLKKQQTT